MERLTAIGKLATKSSKDIAASRIGIGMEKLDRDAFDPTKAYDKVAALGVKWVRLLSGWEKTEQKQGVYDFFWLDDQVDSLLERGITPWLCLSYGNKIYDSFAAEQYGAVGCPPIRSEEAKAAWLAYVKAVATHFAGRVKHYEIWNEPEGVWCWKPEVSVGEYADFAIATADAMRAVDPDLYLMGGSHWDYNLCALNEELERGLGDKVDAFTYHEYTYDERRVTDRMKAMRALCDRHNPKLDLIQGESGAQSQSFGHGALGWLPGSDGLQSKVILRHVVADLFAGVKFSSVFSAVDMNEDLSAKAGTTITKVGYFGVLGAELDPKTGFMVGEYTEKPSYYALQNLCALLDEEVTPVTLPVLPKPERTDWLDGHTDCRDASIQLMGFRKQNGAEALAFWNSTDLLSIRDFDSAISLQLAAMGDIFYIVDPMDGTVYEIPEKMREIKSGVTWLRHLPLRDYPLFLCAELFFEMK